MWYRIVIALIMTNMISLMSLGQNERDALFFSRDEITGSARSISMGGAFSALGGDISGTYINPAGIGVYRSNEFSIGLGFHTSVSLSDYYDNSSLDSKSNLNIPSLGIVGVNEIKSVGKWRSTSMAFGMHRAQSFHRSYSIMANDVPSSMIDSYQKTILNDQAEPSELGNLYPFDIFLAWQTYVLDTFEGLGYYNAAGVLPVDQSYSAAESGAKRETFFSFGGNYDDKLYLGANINFSRISFERSYTHSESINPSDTTTVLKQYAFQFDESFSGLGASVSAGLIYRPITPLRIGLSFKSPTVYSLDLEYESNMTATFANPLLTQADVYDERSPYLGQYQFRLTSPTRATFGLAYVIGKLGMVSIDAEYVNYTRIRMQGISDGYNFNAEENAIRNQLQSALNLRFGAEYRLSQFWSLRGGFAQYGDPHTKGLVDQGSFQLYSIGFGFRNAEYFLDAAYQLRSSEEVKFLYDPTLVDPAYISQADHRITATFGFKF